MMWLKRVSFMMLICFMAIKFSGCAFQEQGEMSEVTCPIGQINVTWFDPFLHVYQLSGGCTIEDVDAKYYVAAYWYPDQGNLFEALVIVNALEEEYKAIVRASCPNGDPLLYGDSGCVGRSFEDKKGNIPAEFRSVFESNPCPFLLTPEWKAALIAQDRWPTDTKPVLWIPSATLPANFRYTGAPPNNVPILFELPFRAGEPYNWKLFFAYQKWDPGNGDWSPPSEEITCNINLSSAGKHTVLKTISLERGKYRLQGVRYQYRKGGNTWDSDQFFMPVEFYVGESRVQSPLKIPKEFLANPGDGGRFDLPRPESFIPGGSAKPYDVTLFEKMPVSKPAIFLSGRKTYGLKESATFMVQGEVKGNPILEFSPDGMNWSMKTPKNAMVNKLGAGAQQRCELQADTPGWYRVRFGELYSEPIKVNPKMTSGIQGLKETAKIKKRIQFEPGAPNEESVNKPDLAVKFFYLETDKKDYPDHYILAFQVTNQGNDWSYPTTLSVTCEIVGGGSCPPYFPGPYNVVLLDPGVTTQFLP